MKNYRITFSHNGKEYTFTRSISAGLSEYIFKIAYRTEIRNYMEENKLKGKYTFISIVKIKFPIKDRVNP